MKYSIITIELRYNRALHPTRWNVIRQSALYGLFTGWLSMTTYIVYAMGFIFGAILMTSETLYTLTISDILVVRISYPM